MPTPARRFAALVLLIGAASSAGPSGCASKQPQSSRLQASDFELASTEVTQQLASSDFLKGRSEASPVIVLQPRPMENLSDERLSVGDQWSAMSLVLKNPAVLDLLRSKNVQVLVPAESRYDASRAGIASTTPSGNPSHVFQPVLRSLSRAGSEEAGQVASARKDVFLMEYAITEIDSRRVVWAGQTTLARLAHGRLID